MIQFKNARTDGRKDKRKGRQTLFNRTTSATAGDRTIGTLFPEGLMGGGTATRETRLLENSHQKVRKLHLT